MLIKTLHVCKRYNQLTQNSLPPDVDFFGKCLLGETSISGFVDTLNHSARNADMFLAVMTV